MNDNNLINNQSNQGKYHATRNLNTEIENPEINVNSVTGVNIKDISSTNKISNNDTIASYFNNGNGLNNSIVDNNEILNANTPKIENTNINLNKRLNDSNDTVMEEKINNTSSYENSKKQVIYEPTLKEKKTQKQNLKIPTELLVMFLVVIILLIVVIVIPYIHEIIQEIQLKLTR